MTRLFRRILVPHDFSEHATRALKLAAELARTQRGRLLVLHVIAPFYPVTGLPPADGIAWIPPDDLVEQEQERLERLVGRLVKGRGAPRATCRVVIGDPYQRIIAAAREVDSIVMPTAGRTGLAHLLIGSVTEKVVRHAPVPVLTLRTGSRTASRRRR
jgi:universal stress protein A